MSDNFTASLRLTLCGNPTRRVPVSERLTAYLTAIFGKGTRTYTIAFDKLAHSFSCTRRTVENAVSTVRKSGDFVFKTVRVGRSYAVQVSGRNRYTKRFFPLPRKKEKIQNNTGVRPGFSKNVSGWASKPPPRKIQALAAFVARNELGRAHRAQSRTMFRFAHAYNFALEALHGGHARTDVVDAYRYALRSVDTDLAHLPRESRWEPSSLVRLARFRLRDGQNVAERVRYRAAALRHAKRPAVTPVTLEVLTHKPTAPTKAETAVFCDEIAALMALHAAA